MIALIHSITLGKLTTDEKAEARRKADIDAKMKAMIREILFYVGFLLLLLIVVNGQQNNNSYLQNKNLVSILTVGTLTNTVSID